MNWQEYIESGLLELYVMGSLSDKEMEEIRALELAHPELAEEIDKIQTALLSFSEESSDGYSTDLIQKVKSEIADEAKTVDQETSSGGASIISLQSRLRTIRSVAAAIAALLIISIGVNFLQYKKGEKQSEQLARLEDELVSQKLFEAQLQRTNNEQKLEFNQLLTHINDTGTVVVRMAGQAIDPSAFASVYWNPQTQITYVNPTFLPKTDDEHQYQLWALVDGKPIDAGVFERGSDLEQVKLIKEAQAFAVTLEPKGGSVNPTLEQLFVLGTVPKV